MLKIWLPLVNNINNQGLQISNFVNTGATLSVTGPLGNAYSFNGSSNQIYGSYNCQEASFTVCMWAYFNKINVHLLDMRNSDGSGYQPMYVGSSGIQVGGSNSSYIYINFVPTLNTWYHLCVVSDSTKTQLYVNGEYYGQTTSARATNFNKDIDIHIGSRYSGSNWFDGYVCDFRLYNNVLSPYEIKDISKGLLLHYKYRTYVDNTLVDSSGFGRNGMCYGDVDFAEIDNIRYGGGFYVGDTQDDYVSRVSPSAATKTISFWIVTAKTPSTVAFADYKSKMAFGFNASGYIIATCDSWNKPMFTNSSAFISSSPNHIVIRYNASGDGVELFINGIQQTVTGSNNYWTHSSDTLMIGRRSTGSPMNCTISDFRMYATRLSDDDILELYHTSLKQMNNGTSRTFELKENTINKVQVNKNGLLTNNEFVESNINNKFKKTQAISNEFIER